MKLDKPEGKPDEKIAWGSDVAAQMLRRFGIRYMSLTPGASYRGFHDSVVNHLGNKDPGMILCLHEDHAVAVAHGWSKVTGEPMACALHSNVGLMHGLMSMYNAWCDRAPMIVIGATGPLDNTQRRPWIDWIHTTRDQGHWVRSLVKWDDLPSSPQAIVEGMARGNILTRTAPTAPVYICLDAGLQESKLAKEVEFPDLARFTPPPPARPAEETVDKAVALLSRAAKPVMLMGRGARNDDIWQARIKLAERLGAVVLSDLKAGSMFPTDHPAHPVEPFNVLGKGARQILTEADVILSLDWIDLHGAMKQAKTVGNVNAKVIHASLDHHLANGMNMDYQGLPPVDVPIACQGDVLVTELLGALGAGRKDSWKPRQPAKPKDTGGDIITLNMVAATLKAAFNDISEVGFASLCKGWPVDIWPHQHPYAYMGKDGGGGIGSGPGISVGVALALHDMGKLAVTVLGDGDFLMGANAIWTAVHYEIPLLVLINNNESYFNDELHQETVAVTRGREPKNRWIGQASSNPTTDIAKLCEAQGAIGIGPVTK
ncbi:MAG TPA: thiamine pyrophosphate-binding protein, partial [Xanthobacteraceae bacterium]|nr:thiamine pyrophosphate-binding protein [Xanthobacteraceae bacterium]